MAVMRLEIIHVQLPEYIKYLINGNFDHLQSRAKALKHMKTAMPISYCAFPFPFPF
jgi:hypothetical protein